ncbi:branched-chain amino acid ABC transporter permease [Fodinicurvata sp. EGI_FJ10296]|uniref:branched-chain amino acid ABC transporter permease n=1 Tax=Fodinicurvata sp. EGI_FJ10296 TaxID=3231908 RepID=UPI0034570EC6
MIEFIQLVVYGVILGSIIALGAIGVSLIFGILRFAHFAHGDLMTVGAYIGLVLVVDMTMPLWLAFPIAMAVGAVVALGIDQVVYKPLRRMPPILLLIASVGVALILRSLIEIIWGPSVQVYQTGIRPLIPYMLDEFGIRLRWQQINLFLVAAVLVAAMHAFLQYTRTGKAMRALSDNMDLARITGIDTERTIRWMWVIAAALAVAAGILMAIDTRAHPIMGWRMLLPIFAAAILGGIGKPYGAIAGGLVIGISQEVSTMFIDSAYKPAVSFAILVAMLIVRPQGLFGGKTS